MKTQGNHDRDTFPFLTWTSLSNQIHFVTSMESQTVTKFVPFVNMEPTLKLGRVSLKTLTNDPMQLGLCANICVATHWCKGFSHEAGTNECTLLIAEYWSTLFMVARGTKTFYLQQSLMEQQGMITLFIYFR